MPKPAACVDAQRCHPETCNRGVCPAMAFCARKVLRQEALYEVPVITQPELCRGCFLCLPACPMKAIIKC